ncbi:MAG: AMP-binding protein [Micromonosporaceae bacterium]
MTDLIHTLTLADIVSEHRRSRPDVLAVIDDSAGVRLTYTELDDRACRLARGLAAAGAGPGARVLWLGRNSFRVLETLLAAARLGAVFCPANWRQSPDELAFVLSDLDPAVVVWEESEEAAKARDHSGSGARWILAGDEYEAMIAGGDPGAPGETAPGPGRELAVDPDSPVLALYTAAFDGRPNAAMLSHSALIAHNMALAYIRHIPPGFVFLNSGPLFHVGTMMFCLATFHLGGSNVFTPAFDPEETCRLIEAERCTHAFLFGPMIDQLVTANAGGRYDLKSLHFMSHSPEWDAMITVDSSPWCQALGGYGQTEVAGMLTFLGLGIGGAGGAGRPSPLVAVRIVDDAGAELPPGDTGEIVARGHHLMTGYWNRPGLTAAKQAGGWHHTGDLGRREADGTITFIGPKLRMIKSGAENIYPAEVERALKSHPAVADVAVIGVPDEKWGQSVMAIVVLKDGGAASEDDLIDHVRGQIASYKKPRSVVFAQTLPKKGYTPDYDALDEAYGGGGYPGTS